MWKSIRRNVFCGIGMEDQVEKFIKASDQEYIKYIKAEYWQFNEKSWINF